MKDEISNSSSLLLALLENQFEAVTRFLDADAKDCIAEITDLTSLRGQLSQIKEAPAELIESFFTAWKLQNSPDDIVKMLLENGCSLECVLLAKDPEMTQEFLSLKLSIDKDDSKAAVKRAVDSVDIQNLQVLVADGPDVETRRMCFSEQVCKKIKCLYPNMHILAFFLDQPSPFSLNDEFPIEILYKPELTMILRYDKANHFEANLLRKLFSDQHQEVIEQLHGKKMNLGQVDPYNRVIRHAVNIDLGSNIRFLLDVGANIKNGFREGEYLCNKGSIDTFEMLLRAGAGLQYTDLWSNRHRIELVLAQLALDESRGVLLSEQVLGRIQHYNDLSNHYVKCRELVEWMKTTVICKNVTVFDALTGDVENLAECKCLRENIFKVLLRCREKMLIGYYYSALEEQLYTAAAVQKVRRRAAQFIGECDVGGLGSLVVDKIMGYLSLRDLRFYVLPVDLID